MKGFKNLYLRKNVNGLDPKLFAAQRIKANAWALTTICIGLSLWFFLMIVRTLLIGYSFKQLLTSPVDMVRVILGSHYDFLLVLGLTLFFIAIGLPARKNKPLTALVRGSFFFMGIAVQLLGIFSALFYQKTGGGITYQWLVYSDFFQSTDSQNAIMANINGQVIGLIAGFSTLFILFSYLIRWGFYRLKISHYIPMIMVLFTIAYIPISKWHFSKRPWKGMQIINPVLAFIESMPMFQEQPGLFSMPLEEEDIHAQINMHQSPSNLPVIDSTGNIKNVIILVLESVPAEYLEVYGGKYPVTPNIKKFEDRSLQIDYAYAHTPSTNRAMFSTLSSLYPKISFNSITKNHTEIQTPTITSELGEKGYRTSFFTSADNRFQDIGDYLKAREFNAIGDYQTIECESADFNASISGWKFLDGIEDLCVGGKFANWMDENPEQPFFSMLWTVQTHYPYYTTGEIEDFQAGTTIENQYLNALKDGDSLFGQVMNLLIEKELDDETLVVLMGDHGEAFGKHNQTGHANQIYEENVRIPLIFYHPNLFQGEKLNIIAGEIDIAPSIFNVLNIETPQIWQGQSIFSENFRNSAFMFSPYSRFVFGYRYDNYKVIYDAGHDNFEVFDLTNDPGELDNIATQVPEITQEAHRKLASWVQYHEQIMAPLLNE